MDAMKKTPPTRSANATRTLVDPTRVLARHIMSSDVLVLRAEDPIRLAAEQLEEIGASGAPVVDGGGRLVGVLTTKDIARSEHVDDEGLNTRIAGADASDDAGTGDAAGFDEELSATEAFGERLFGRARIGDWMAPGVTTVGPDTMVGAACRLMVDEGIHRVFVVEEERLVGVVSTKDVVRLLASPPRER
jgi:CBS domain-containing protein